MDTKRLTALTGFSYASKRLFAGDEFLAKSDRDAKLLIAIKKAKLTGRPLENIGKPNASLVNKIENIKVEDLKEENVIDEVIFDDKEHIKEELAEEVELKEISEDITINERTTRVRRGRKPNGTR